MFENSKQDLFWKTSLLTSIKLIDLLFKTRHVLRNKSINFTKIIISLLHLMFIPKCTPSLCRFKTICPIYLLLYDPFKFGTVTGGLKVKEALQQVHGGALLGVQDLKPLKNVGIFTSGGQINNLKTRRNLASWSISNVSSTTICFEIKFCEDWLWNSIKRLNFLCHLTDIKIAWINP